MLETKNNLIVIIPSYEPQKDFIDYAKAVSEVAMRLVVVNDGSGKDYDYIFDEISRIDNVTYLTYERNHGKGYALKTALKYCASEFDDESVIVTADCDGQHALEDVIKVYKAALSHKGRLILGSRNFDLNNVPPKSRLGNRLIRRIYKLFYGIELYDTQTGLRGFTVSLANKLIGVRGDRFEYEMSVLIYAKKHNIEILEVPIRTIYPDDPKEHITHYKPIRDSVRILGVVLKNLNLFILVSIISGLLDIAIFHLFVSMIFPVESELYTLIATVVARVSSSILNFILNAKYVFNSASKKSIIKYYLLWVANLGASYGLTVWLGNGVGYHLTITKFICDIGIGFISYQVQNHWVFKRKSGKRFFGFVASFVRKLLRIFMPKYRSNVLSYDEPVVYVCRHLNMHGPLVTLSRFKFDVHPLVFNPFLDKRECYRQYADYTFTKRVGKSKKKFNLKAYIASRFVPKLMRSMRSVPVYRDFKNVLKTFDISMEYLLRGESLIVFPDIEYTEGKDNESEIYDGFLYLGQLYYKKTGSQLKFIPVYINEQDKTIDEFDAITVNNYRLDKPLAKDYIKSAINGREGSCKEQ